MDSWFKMWERAKANRRVLGVDPAKTGSDETVICATDHNGFQYAVFKGQPQTIVRTPLPPQAVEPKSSVDHTWDMLVLAARSSRYGE